MYFTRVYFTDKYCMVKNYTQRGEKIPLRNRIKRMRDTTKAMKRYNNSRRAEKIQLLILNNFEKGYHITLDYPKGQRPETYEQAEKILTTFLHKMSRRLKRKGKQFKYIAVTERGRKAAALHHHMIIERDGEILDEMLSVWGQHMHISVMYEEGQYKDLAEYLVKIETKEELTKGKSKYHRSRNLKKPMERFALVDGILTDSPYVPPGYKLMEHSVVNGFNELIGVRYQKYMLKRLPDPEEELAKKYQEPPKVSESVRNCPKRSKTPNGVTIATKKKESIWKKLGRKIFRRKP